VVYLINSGPSVALNCGIPKEACTGNRVNLNHLCTFNCISYIHVDLDHRSKLDPKSKRCIFIGYGTSEYDYLFWDRENRKSFRHKDMVFNEQKMYKNLLTERSTLEKIPEWHLGALRNSRMLWSWSSSNLMMFL